MWQYALWLFLGDSEESSGRDFPCAPTWSGCIDVVASWSVGFILIPEWLLYVSNFSHWRIVWFLWLKAWASNYLRCLLVADIMILCVWWQFIAKTWPRKQQPGVGGFQPDFFLWRGRFWQPPPSKNCQGCMFLTPIFWKKHPKMYRLVDRFFWEKLGPIKQHNPQISENFFLKMQ